MPITSVNPATNETIESFPHLSKDETRSAIEQATAAYGEWKRTSFDQRTKALLEFASSLRDRADEFARLITLDMGKRISESRREVEYCAEIAEFYANGAEEFLADQPMELDEVNAYIRYEPIGVLLGVMPWNFPFYQVVRFAAPNIMAGNAVMVKHASNVPQCARAIAELFAECGLPAGVYTNLFIPTDFVESIISDKRVQGVSLTGSEKAGAAVAGQAGKNLKRSVLELGGNDPFIVLEDADLKKTVELAVKGRMVNTGQSCVAAKRFIVVESVADDFLTAYVGLNEIGKPMEGDTVFVSAASGAVGSIVCQIAKLKKCRVIGSAGSKEKIEWLKHKAGVDDAFNDHEVQNISAKLAELCPNGIDLYFDNVGGDHLEGALDTMNDFGRIVCCGMISSYNAKGPTPGPQNMSMVIGKRLRIQGFIVRDHMDQTDAFQRDMTDWIRSEKIFWRETITEGLENAPNAFIALFTGDKRGKSLVKLA